MNIQGGGGIFQGLDIIGTGLRAEMMRSEVVAANLANANDTGNVHNEPYRRKSVTFDELLTEGAVPVIVEGTNYAGGKSRMAMGVQVTAVHEDTETPFREFYDKGHADAGPDGWVLGSNVDMFKELVDMSVIERSFQADLSAMRAYRSMIEATIQEMRR